MFASRPSPPLSPSQCSRTAAARPRSAGFTLMEIMIVVVIVGLLAAVILPNLLSSVDEARDTKARQDIRAYMTALTQYRLDNFVYPTTEQGLKALIEEPADGSAKNWRKGGYLQDLQVDPWKNEYHYAYPSEHGKDYDVYTLGADNKPGGTDANFDIGNWNLSAPTK